MRPSNATLAYWPHARPVQRQHIALASELRLDTVGVQANKSIVLGTPYVFELRDGKWPLNGTPRADISIEPGNS